MKPIKIMGEAKTATTYLQKLLQINTNAQLCSTSVNDRLGWKHGFPLPGNALHIFLMRDPFEWVKSYLADPSDARFQGLRSPFGNREDHPYQKHWGTWSNMMECRNYKYKAYREFVKQHGGILLKTEHLKANPDCITVLRDFGYTVSDPVVDIERHVYKDVNGKDDPNRKPLRKDQWKWVRKNDNVSFVDKLTIQVY